MMAELSTFWETRVFRSLDDEEGGWLAWRRGVGMGMGMGMGIGMGDGRWGVAVVDVQHP